MPMKAAGSRTISWGAANSTRVGVVREFLGVRGAEGAGRASFVSEGTAGRDLVCKARPPPGEGREREWQPARPR